MMNYSFFGRLNLVVETHGRRGWQRYLSNEYLRIADTTLAERAPTVKVEIVDELPPPSPGDIRGSTRYKRMFNFSYLIRGLDTPEVTISFRSHWIDKVYMNAIGVYLQAQLLEPVMYLKLLEQNVLFMHAAGVATDDAGYLLPAHGGTGKTTTSMALLSQGFRLLGDDLLFVDLDTGIVHPYPRPLHVFTYNVRNLHGATVPFRYTAAIYTKNVIRFVLERVLNTELLISTRVHADELFDENPFGSSVPYRRVCFLVKDGDPVRDVAVTDANVAQLAGEIMQSADLNDSLYEVIGDEDRIAEIKRLEQKVVGDLLLQFDRITYVNTRKLDLDDLGPFVEEQLAPSPH